MPLLKNRNTKMLLFLCLVLHHFQFSSKSMKHFGVAVVNMDLVGNLCSFGNENICGRFWFLFFTLVSKFCLSKFLFLK